jgi:hypothetical protein
MTKNKKENKTKTPASAPAASENQPEKKKSSACLPLLIVGVIFLLAGIFLLVWMWPFIFSFIMDLRSGDFSLPKISQTPRGTLRGKDLSSLIDPSQTVTKRITAKDGGQITARAKSGLYFTLNIAPGSLEEDTDISVTPVGESPIENYDPDDPGVVIGPPGTSLGSGSSVSVSGNQPSGSGSQPGAGVGSGTASTPPGTPPETPPETPPGLPPGTTGNVPDLGSLAEIFGNNPSIAIPGNIPSGQGGATGSGSSDRNDNGPAGSSGDQPRFSDRDVMIFVDYNGGVHTVPATISNKGNWIMGPIDETGATSTDDPDEEESESIADNAASNSGAASSGACTGEYIEALARTIATASAAGDTAAVSRYESEIRRCNSESANHLQYLCDNNPTQLRRKDFQNRLALARALPASEGAATVIEWLMNDCQNKYRFRGEGTNPQAAAGGVRLLSSLDANVCGYLDDEWEGTQTYEMSPGANTFHHFEGQAKFRLPPNGGSFSGTSRGTQTYVVAGRGVPLPNIDFGFMGNFDGNATIASLNLYPEVILSNIPITLEEMHCVSLAPMPR